MTRSRLTLLILALLSVCSITYARVIGTPPTNPDVFCAGGTPSAVNSNEVCVDYSGNIVPTTTDTQTLGSASLEWNTANIKTLSIGTGGTTSTGPGLLGTNGSANSLGTGNSAAPTTQTVLGNLVLSKSTIGSITAGIFVSTVVPVLSPYETLYSSAAAGSIELTSTPSIATTTVAGGVPLASGTYLVISSTLTTAVIFDDEGTLTGSRLQLGAARRSVSQYKTLVLIFDATDGYWREISYGNN